MVVVLDASAWVDALTGGAELDPDSPRPTVPPHFDVEVLGSVRGMQQRGLISSDKANQAFARHGTLVCDRVFSAVDVARAWELREALSFRDAWYVALAERLTARWVTADRKAARTAKRLGIAVQIV